MHVLVHEAIWLVWTSEVVSKTHSYTVPLTCTLILFVVHYTPISFGMALAILIWNNHVALVSSCAVVLTTHWTFDSVSSLGTKVAYDRLNSLLTEWFEITFRGASFFPKKWIAEFKTGTREKTIRGLFSRWVYFIVAFPGGKVWTQYFIISNINYTSFMICNIYLEAIYTPEIVMLARASACELSRALVTVEGKLCKTSVNVSKYQWKIRKAEC